MAMGKDGRREERAAPSWQPSRRAFLKAACTMGAALAALGTAGVCLPHARLLRPPGGQDEAAFLARCIRCDRCRSICPTRAVGLAHAGDGLINVRTPRMEFHQGICDFCGLCAAACPTGALRPFEGENARIGVAAVQKEGCLAWEGRGCRICAEACPYGAISLDAKMRPVIAAEKCNGCGVCEHVCPSLVLQSYRGGSLRGVKVLPLGEGTEEGGEER